MDTISEAVGYASIGVEKDDAFAALAAQAIPALSRLRATVADPDARPRRRS